MEKKVDLHNIRTFELTYDKLIVGSTLEALTYSYCRGIPLIYKENKKPHIFAKTSADQSKLELWQQMFFFTSLANLNPLGEYVSRYMIYPNDNKIEVITEQQFRCIIKYNKLIIFDDDGLDGLPPPRKITTDKVEVLDWFNATQVEPHKIEFIEDKKNTFVTKIQFYIVGGAGEIKRRNLVGFSYMKQKDTIALKRSESLSRLKAMHMMREAGIVGQINNGTYRNPIKLDLTKREIYPLGRNIFDKINDNIEFNYMKYEQILKKKENISVINDLERHLNVRRIRRKHKKQKKKESSPFSGHSNN